MGCPITKDKLECNMLALKLKRIEIRIAKDKEMENYKKKTGEDLAREPIPDYIDYNGTVKIKAKDEGNNENNKDDITSSTIKMNNVLFPGTPYKSLGRSKTKKNSSSGNVVSRGNGADSIELRKIKLKRYKTGKSIKNSKGELDSRRSMNSIRLIDKYSATNRDFYPMNSLLFNGLRINEKNQYLSCLQDNKNESKNENDKVEYKSRRKLQQYENLYNDDDELDKKKTKINIQHFKDDKLVNEESFYKPQKDEANAEILFQQYERRFTNKLDQYLDLKIKENIDKAINKD